MIVSLYADGRFKWWYNKRHLSAHRQHLRVKDKINRIVRRNDHKSYFTFDLRQSIVAESAWFLITDEQIEFLAKQLRDLNVIEIAAGTGYLAALLRDAGVRNYRAIDPRILKYCKDGVDYGIEYLPFEDLTIDQYHTYDVVVLTWPPYDHPLGADVIRSMRVGQYLYLQGESSGGCTGDRDMFDLLDQHFVEIEYDEFDDLPNLTWVGIYDDWSFYRKVS